MLHKYRDVLLNFNENASKQEI